MPEPITLEIAATPLRLSVDIGRSPGISIAQSLSQAEFEALPESEQYVDLFQADRRSPSSSIHGRVIDGDDQWLIATITPPQPQISLQGWYLSGDLMPAPEPPAVKKFSQSAMAGAIARDRQVLTYLSTIERNQLPLDVISQQLDSLFESLPELTVI